jgi:hypothetical protein
MAYSATDTRLITLRSRFEWYWLRSKGNNGKQNRKAVKFLSKFRPLGMGVAIYWIKKNSDLQNPPSGPPIFSL